MCRSWRSKGVRIMDKNAVILNLSSEEVMQLERIALDDDKDEALSFLKDLRKKIRETTIRGLKSHLDA
jgi:hypothetical protein